MWTRILDFIHREPVRTWVYGVATALVALLVFYGVVSAEAAPLILAVVVAVSAVPAAEVPRSKVSPVEDAK